jgi:D-alanyl-lipoteichoic acid acyltransferase DltB (MBOAT superfamily)
MGVWGGLLLVFLFIGILVSAFSILSKALRRNKNAPREEQFMIWTLGAILFGHLVNFLSISYFDQSVVYFYLLLAGIASYHSRVIVTNRRTPVIGTVGAANRNNYFQTASSCCVLLCGGCSLIRHRCNSAGRLSSLDMIRFESERLH